MPGTKPIGILAALEEEMAELEAVLSRPRGRERAGVRFVAGRLDERPVVLAEAGIGKVSAAQVTTLLLDRFGCGAVVVSGVAGGLDPRLGIGDLVVAERLAQQDYGALTNGGMRNYRPGAPPFGERRHELYYTLPRGLGARLRDALAGLELPLLSAATTGSKPRRPELHFGTILSGDQFINAAEARRALRRRFPGALAVEMEGAAAAQIAERHGAPCVVVRAVSDLAGAESHVDFLAFLPAAGAAAAMAVRRILPAL
ncbi:MAG: 5'-methylthioadenosine/adenosylhomocysteine nucleosidase [Pseudomonadota bacterium]